MGKKWIKVYFPFSGRIKNYKKKDNKKVSFLDMVKAEKKALLRCLFKYSLIKTINCEIINGNGYI